MKRVDDEVVVAVQVNGKVRGEVEVSAGSSQKDVEKLAFEMDEIKKWRGEASINDDLTLLEIWRDKL